MADEGPPADRPDLETLRREVEDQEKRLKEKRAALAKQELAAKHGRQVPAEQLLAELAEQRHAHQQKQLALRAKAQSIQHAKAQQVNALLELQENARDSERTASLDELAQLRLAFKQARTQRQGLEAALSQQVSIIEAIADERQARERAAADAEARRAGRALFGSGGGGGGGGGGAGSGTGDESGVPPTDSGVKYADLLGPAAATHASSMVDKKAAHRLRTKAAHRRERMREMKRLNLKRCEAASAAQHVVDGVEDTTGLMDDLEASIAANAARIENLYRNNTVEHHTHKHPLFPDECFVEYDGSLGRDSYPAHQNTSYRLCLSILRSVVDTVLRRAVPRDVKTEILAAKREALAMEATRLAEIVSRDSVDTVIREVAAEVLHGVVETGAMDVWSEMCYVDAVTSRRTEKLVLTAAAQTMLAAASTADVAPVSHRLMGSYAQLRDHRRKLDAALRSTALVHRHSTRMTTDDDAMDTNAAFIDDIILSRADLYVIPFRHLVASHLVLFTRNPVRLSLVGKYYARPPPNDLRANALWVDSTGLLRSRTAADVTPDHHKHQFSRRQVPDSASWRRFASSASLSRSPAGWDDPLFCATLLNLPEVWPQQQSAWGGMDVTPLTVPLPKPVKGPPQTITALASSRCGRYFAAGQSRGGLLVWDLGLLLRWFKQNIGPMPDPLLLARLTTKFIPPASQCPVRRVAWGRSTTQLVTTDAHGVVRVWSLAAQPPPSYAVGVPPPKKASAAPPPFDAFASFRVSLGALDTAPVRSPRLVTEFSAKHFLRVIAPMDPYGEDGSDGGDPELSGAVVLDDNVGLVRVLDREATSIRPRTALPVPETAVFFATTTVLGHQPSVLVACRDGSVVKWSLSFVSGDDSAELDGVVLKGRQAPSPETLALYADRVGSGVHAPFQDHLESRHLFVSLDAKFLYMLSSHVATQRLRAARRSRMRKKLRLIGMLRGAQTRGAQGRLLAAAKKAAEEKAAREVGAVGDGQPTAAESGDGADVAAAADGNADEAAEERKKVDGEEEEEEEEGGGGGGGGGGDGTDGVEETKADSGQPQSAQPPPPPTPSSTPGPTFAAPLPDYSLALEWNPDSTEATLIQRGREVSRMAERRSGVSKLSTVASSPLCTDPVSNLQLLAEPFALLSSTVRQRLDPTTMFSPSRSKYELVEPLEAHQHPVVFLGYVDPLVCSSFDPDFGVACPVPPCFITLDSVGMLGVWVYDDDAASPHATLLPRHVVMLDQTMTQLVPTNTTTTTMFPPHGATIPPEPDTDSTFIRRGREAMQAVTLGPKWSARVWGDVVQSVFLPQQYPVGELYFKAKKGDADAEVVVDLIRSTPGGTLLSHTQQSCLPKLRAGEVLSARLTKSRRELVVMSLYPAAHSEPSLLRVVMVDLIQCKAVPPMIEIPVMDMESEPQMEVTHVHGDVGTDFVIVLVNGTLRVFGLSSGLQVNEGESAPLSAVETAPELRVLHVFGRDPTFVALGGTDTHNMLLLALSPELSKSVRSTHRTAMTPLPQTLIHESRAAWDLDAAHVAFACRCVVLEMVDAVLRVRRK